ncbi:hypothetical protein K523DRAFT_140125 [Schizophyllum commune Tattone D]|nr:hypothetical protein K523DRAFT_140125 [Schizophyllum commune Tattone D]
MISNPKSLRSCAPSLVLRSLSISSWAALARMHVMTRPSSVEAYVVAPPPASPERGNFWDSRTCSRQPAQTTACVALCPPTPTGGGCMRCRKCRCSCWLLRTRGNCHQRRVPGRAIGMRGGLTNSARIVQSTGVHTAHLACLVRLARHMRRARGRAPGAPHTRRHRPGPRTPQGPRAGGRPPGEIRGHRSPQAPRRTRTLRLRGSAGVAGGTGPSAQETHRNNRAAQSDADTLVRI